MTSATASHSAEQSLTRDKANAPDTALDHLLPLNQCHQASTTYKIGVIL